MESREDFYFDNSDNLESDDTIEKEEHYKWTIALEEETKEDAFIPEEDLLEQAEPEVAERLILKRDLRKAAIARMEAAARTQGDFEDVIDAWVKEDKNRERRERYHEVCRDDAEVPFEYNMSPDEIVIPAPIHFFHPRFLPFPALCILESFTYPLSVFLPWHRFLCPPLLRPPRPGQALW